MKLAFALTQLEAGGAQSRVLQTADLLREQGHVVDVYFFYRKRDAFVDSPRIVLSERRGLVDLARSAFRLNQALRVGRYDAFIANTAPACILGSAAALFARIPTRIAVQTQPPSRLPLAYRVLDLLAGSAGLYKVNIANSYWTYGQFAGYPRRYRKRIRVVHDGIRAKASAMSRDEARSTLGVLPQEFRYVTVGRLSEQKNQGVLIEALARIPYATLALIGDGPLRGTLEQTARRLSVDDRVQFVGELPGETVALHLRAADAFVFPSRWETFGLASVEAASAGLPILASDLDVHREVLGVVSRAHGPIFVAPTDVSGWVTAMNEVQAADNGWREEARLAGLAIASAHSLENHVDRMLEVISSQREASAAGPSTHGTSDASTGGGVAPTSVHSLIARIDPDLFSFWLDDGNLPARASIQDHIDVIFSLYLTNELELVNSKSVDQFLAAASQVGLAGWLPDGEDTRLSVHNTAYLLAALNLLPQPTADLYASVVGRRTFSSSLLVDVTTALPKFPPKWAHHSWRVSHWIGGVPSILLSLERSGIDVDAEIRGLTARVRDAIEAKFLNQANGLLRTYRSSLVHSSFNALYRVRHDPELGELGGVSHLLWVDHAMGRPYTGVESLQQMSSRLFRRNQPFMEGLPYCLDFDVLHTLRTASEQLGVVDSTDQDRAHQFRTDIERFFQRPSEETTLHRIPGALAAYHEAGLLAGLDGIDVIQESHWL